MSGKKTFFKIIILAVLIAIVVFLFYDANYGKNIVGITLAGNRVENEEKNTVDGDEETTIPAGSIRLEEDGKSVFVPYGKGFMHFTRDGVKFYTGLGKLSWSDVYSMSSPSVVTGGEYCAVVDLLGKTAKVYNIDGLAYTIQTDDSIHFISVNKNGNAVLILNGKNDYKVQVYNSSGNLKFQRFDEDEGVFPVCADISDDNKVLAVAYTDTSDISLLSKVLFFYTNKDDSTQANTNDMFAACEVNDEIIAAINYLSGEEYVCVSDKGVFAINTSGDTVWRNDTGNVITDYGFSENGYIAVGYGDEIINDTEPVEKGTICIYNFSGKKTGSITLGDDIESIYAGDEYLVVSSSGEYYGIKTNGSILWQHKPTQDITAILPLNGNDVLYATKSYADVTQLSR